MKKIFTILLLNSLIALANFAVGQNYSVTGKVAENETGEALGKVKVYVQGKNVSAVTNEDGTFELKNLSSGTYKISAFLLGYATQTVSIQIKSSDKKVNFTLPLLESTLDELEVTGEQELNSITRLNAVEKTAIYASKKNEVILPNNLAANLATNNSRQIYASVPGLNIWESDGAGLQLGIGARGLDPNRTSNFNVRQNGYDISADALGYPESYYTPPTEALQKIELVRGAASLQYGTQFGGLLNFIIKKGPKDKAIEVTSRQTLGSFGFFNSFNSVGGTVKKLNYYTFYQHKQGDGWRPNSQFDLDMWYGGVNWNPVSKLKINLEYTYMKYLAKQPGGLTDAMFNEDPRQSIRDRNWFRVNWNLFSLSFYYDISDNLLLNVRNFGLIGGRDALGNLQRIDRVDDNTERNLFVDDFKNFGNETRLIYHYNTFNQPSALLTGIRFYKGDTQRMQGNGSAGSDADFHFLNPESLEDSDFDFPGYNFSAFVENVFNLSEKLSITPGLRFEYINTQADGYYQSSVLVKDPETGLGVDSTFNVYEDKERVRSFMFFGLGASYWLSDDLEIYGNFSRNFRAINFNDIRVNNPNLVVDEDIQDESGFNFDLGFRGKYQDWFNFDISAFYLKYNGRIGSILRVDETNYRSYRYRTNVGDSRHIGLEAFTDADILKLLHSDSQFKLKLFGNVSLINAEYVASKESAIKGNKVELVPDINLKTGLSFGWKKLKASLLYSYTDEQFSDASNATQTPSAVEGIIPAYYVMDFSASYSYKWFLLEAGCNNLTDNMYFTRRASGYPGPGIIPSDGRSFYATLGVKF
ncbi:MAG: iron(III) dicitrate transport protein FecA [Thalassobius sp.]|nr:iron(III) dicitrate transport protein FecA [Thalassovita sp.]